MIVIVVPGALRGKGRPRFGRTRGGAPVAYTDAKTNSAEAWVRLLGAQAMAGMAPLDGPLAVHIDIRCEVPKSWPKTRSADAMAGAIMPTTKPDLDNIIKLVGDALNGVVWGDDVQIVSVSARKRYAEQAASTITVTQA